MQEGDSDESQSVNLQDDNEEEEEEEYYGNEEGDNGLCCSKATVLLADDLVFNMIPLEQILVHTYGLTCDKA